MTVEEDAELGRLLWPRVDASGGPDACWPWTGSTNQYGYGTMRVPGGWDQPHRVAYTITNGPIRDTLDHTCHTEECTAPPRECPHRRCANPAHTVDVTRAVNSARINRRKKAA